MAHPFDQLELSTLQQRKSMKWQRFDDDILPLWVADMDFPTAPAIANALAERAHSGNLGYPMGYLSGGEPGVIEAITARQQTKHQWSVAADDVWLINGIIPGLYLSCLACSSPGDEVIVQSPIYPPFMMAINNTGRVPRYNPLRWDGEQWSIDFEQLETLVTPATRLLMLCNPHNPTGRVFTRDELEQLADFALRHRLWIVSDELHSDLVYREAKHIPIASLGDEVAARTMTLFGPTKTFNIAGLKMGIAVSSNHDLLGRYKHHATGLVSPPNVMAQTAILAAYTEAEAWLGETLTYLDTNRRVVVDFIRTRLPQVRVAMPEGTYLAWLDFTALNIDNLYDTLEQDCKLALNAGPSYGPGGEGFARLNFATATHIVEEALERLEHGLRPHLD
ncbi:MAG: PatB family C-S lyase [Trueperaceae bacterium]|nr:PatB family C-S lyase [Trueperaceae bacterium]